MLLIKNIGALVTAEGNTAARGTKQTCRVIRDAAVLIDEGKIAGVFGGGKLPRIRCEKELDARGKLCTPALIDCHTHAVFGGWRQHELAKKLAGASYLDILNSGGGILDTVRATRGATEQELYDRTCGFLAEQLSLGIATTEIKSGYGVDLDTELMQLRVISRLRDTLKNTVVATYMGAHAVPPETSIDDYTDFICSEVLPAVKEQGSAQFCDIFCETGVFDVPHSRIILERAKSLGLGIKVHADEIDAIGGSQLAASMGAVSCEHLIAANDSGLTALAASDTTAVLLPLTSMYLGKGYAPARKMIERGIPVAIATDFNPGSCPSLNLQLAMSVAALNYKMTPDEVVCAVTLNAAAAIGLASERGTIEESKAADLVIWDADDTDMLCYRFGSNLANTVIKNGEVL